MRDIKPGDEVFHRVSNIPGTVVRILADIVTVRTFDPGGSGKRINVAYPAKEL